MKKSAVILVSALVMSVLSYSTAYPTASTHVWAPSTDCQEFSTGHVTADVYVPVGDNRDGTRPEPVTNSGLTFGILPFKKLAGEIGFDYKTGYGDLDIYPVYFNGKVAVPENAYFAGSPAVAFGLYDIGTKTDRTDYNLIYAKAARTVSLGGFSFGRFSAGYFWGNGSLLLDEDGRRDNNGMLLAWERTMSEISDKLWVCVEYQGTRSSYGSLNLGTSWQFTKNVSVLAGYEFYNNHSLSDTVTIQVDINF